MIHKVPFFSIEELPRSKDIVKVRIPNVCPLCSTTLEMSPLFGFYSNCSEICNDLKKPYVALKCPKCEGVSFATYECIEPDLNFFGSESLSSYRLYPAPTIQKEFSEDIKNKYPRFCNVYNEALLAESNQLNEICGMGYRKALEILIKDYAIEKNPDKEEEIKKSMLGKCINDYIKSDKIQALSKASVWLGNDETHYEKRHTGHSVREMKLFIDAVVVTIESDITYGKAIDFLSGT